MLRYFLFFAILLFCNNLFAQKMPALVIKNASLGTTNGKAQTLRIDKLQIQITAIGNTAQTTMEMTFYNDTYQTLEGELFFPLAEGQTISRFAMEIDGHLREGVVVEKNKGRKIFEDIVRRGIDPALLEYTKGNAFRTRVYPINPKSYKRIVIAYKEILNLDNQGFNYNLPLSYAEPLRKFMLRIEADKTVKFSSTSLIKNTYTGTVFETEKLNFTPNQALKFTVPKTDKNEVVAVGTGIIHPENTYFYVHLQPEIFKQAKPLPKKIVLLYDISNSAKNRNLKREISILQNYITSLQNVDIQLITFNNAIRSNKNFSIKNGDFAALKTELETQNFDGGTQLGCLDLSKYETDEFLLVSDGVSNFGKHEIAPQPPKGGESTLQNSPFGGKGAIYTINSSPVAEHSYLRFLAETSGGAYLNLTNLTDTQAKNLLLNSPYQFIKCSPLTPEGGIITSETPPSGAGGLDIIPSKPTTITNDFVIAGKIASKQITNNISLKLHFGFGNTIKYTKTIQINLANKTSASLSENLWASLKINELDLQFKTNEKEIAALSTDFSVVSRNTSMLVLDRLEDYKTYHIKPPAALLAQYPDLKWQEEKPKTAKRIVPKNVIREFIEHKKWYNQTFAYTKEDDETILKIDEGRDAGLSEEEKAMGFGESDDGWGDTSFGDFKEENSRASNMSSPRQISTVRFVPPEPVPDEEVPADEEPPANEFVRDKEALYGLQLPSDDVFDDDVMRVKAPMKLDLPSVTLNLNGVPFHYSAPIPKDKPKSEPEKKSEVTLKPYVANTYYLRKLDSVMQATPPLTPPLLGGEQTPSQKGRAGVGLYQTYLQLKTTYEGNIAFYSDVALWFLAKQDTATAVLVASNLAEMQLENHEVLRLLASIIKQCKQTQLTVDIYKDVLEIREEEPQSFRDLGLAYAENKEKEKAIETLNEVLLQEWDSRFNGIKSLVINELNNIFFKDVILEKKDDIFKKSKLDKRIIYPMSYDLRVVLEWDNDAYDMDLQVTQPNGEVCSKGGIQTTKNGGKMSQSKLPEEFLLRNAMSGNYAINIDYQGSTSQKLPAPVNVTVSIFTNYGRENQKLEQISLRLDKNKRFIRAGSILFEKDSTNESPLTPEGGVYTIRPTTPPSGAGGLSGTDGLLFSPDNQYLISQTEQEISFFDLAKKTITKTLAVPNEFYLDDTTKVHFEFKDLHFITDSTKSYKLLVKMDSIIENLGIRKSHNQATNEYNLNTFSFLKVYDTEKLTVLQSQLLHSKIPVKHTITETDENGNPDSKNSTYNEWKYEEKGKPFELCKQKNAIWQDNKIVQLTTALQPSKGELQPFPKTPPSGAGGLTHYFLPEAILFDYYEKDSTEKVTNRYLALYDYQGKLLKTIRHNLPLELQKVLQYGKEACWVFGYNEEKEQTELYFYTWEKDNEIFREINIVPENENADWISEDGKFFATTAGGIMNGTGVDFIARLYDTQTKQLIFQSFKSDFVISSDSKFFVQKIYSGLVGREIRIREMDKLPKFTTANFKGTIFQEITASFDVFENECAYVRSGEIFTGTEFPISNSKEPIFKKLPNANTLKDLQIYHKGKGKNADKAFVLLNFPTDRNKLPIQNSANLYVYAQQNAFELENWAKNYDFTGYYSKNILQDNFLVSPQGRYIVFAEDSSFTDEQDNYKTQLLMKVLDTDILEQRHTKYKDIKSFEFYNYVAVKVVSSFEFGSNELKVHSFAISQNEEYLAMVIGANPLLINLKTMKDISLEINYGIYSNILFDKNNNLVFLGVNSMNMHSGADTGIKLIKYNIETPKNTTEQGIKVRMPWVLPIKIALSNDEKTFAVASGNELRLYANPTPNPSPFGRGVSPQLSAGEVLPLPKGEAAQLVGGVGLHFTSYFDQRTFHKIRFAAGDKYVITSSKPQTQYGDYFDMGANIKAWEVPNPTPNPSPSGRGVSEKLSFSPPERGGAGDGVFDYPYDDIEDYSERLARIEKGGLLGFMDTLENIVIPMQYQNAENFKNGVAKVTKDNKLGIIDKTGKVILPFEYDAITQTEANTFVVKKGDKYGLFDRQGKELLPFNYVYLKHIVDDLYSNRVFLEETNTNKINLLGLITSSNKVVLENSFYQILDLKNGLVVMKILDRENKTMICYAANRKGEIVIKPQYADIQLFDKITTPCFKVNKEITKGKNKEKYFGVIDSLGKIILPLEYEYIGEFNKGISMIKKRNSYGLIDSTMKIILEPIYQWLGNLQDNFMWVQKNNLYGFADITGKVVIPIIYEEVTDFDKGTALVKQNKHWYRIDQSAKKIIAKQKKYESILPFANGVASVLDNGKYGLIDKQGNEIVVPIYTEIGTYKNGLALVKYEKFGFINPQGQEIIDTKYDELSEFSEGLARFRRDTIHGYLNNLGLEVIKSVDFQEYNDFKNGLAKIKKDDKYGFINKTGKTVVAFVYDEIREFSEGVAAAQINGKWIFIDTLGNKIMKAEFDVVDDFSGGLAKVNSGGKWYFVDKMGNCKLYCE